MNNSQLDNLNELQDLLLALASYDWYFFNDCRVYQLKQDYEISISNNEIFEYYHTNKPYAIAINHDRYTNKHKALLKELIYSL